MKSANRLQLRGQLWHGGLQGPCTTFPFHPGFIQGTNINVTLVCAGDSGNFFFVRDVHLRSWIIRAGVWLLVALVALLAPRPGVFSASPAIAEPHRVVSINLCADQLLLALARRDQIAGVSQWARERANSFMASSADDIPTVHGNSEVLFRLKADLVLLGSYDRHHARAVLERRKIPFLVLEPWTSLDQGRLQIGRVAAALQREARGQALQDEIEARMRELADLSRLLPGGITVLILQRRGFVDRHSLLARLALAAGLSFPQSGPAAARSGIASLEQIVRWRPDFLIVDSRSDRPSDHGEAKLAHPALQRLYPPGRRLAIPPRLSVCGGPSTPALIAWFRDQIERTVLPAAPRGK